MVVAERFYNNQGSNRGHADRNSEQPPLEQIHESLEGSQAVAEQFLSKTEGNNLSILDVGCSWGATVFAFAHSPRIKEVVGIDVELEALELAQAVQKSDLIGKAIAEKTRFEPSAVEKLPFSDNQFDMILCHTVIEHVYNVEQAISEMVRVLKMGGALYIEAPNYLWPHEPHLHLWMLPMGPKPLVKWLSRRLRPEMPANFVDHLQFVNPIKMERLFRKHSVKYQNIYLEKLQDILIRGRYERVLALKKLVPILEILRKIHFTHLIYNLVRFLPFYPSLSYRITKS